MPQPASVLPSPGIGHYSSRLASHKGYDETPCILKILTLMDSASDHAHRHGLICNPYPRIKLSNTPAPLKRADHLSCASFQYVEVTTTVRSHLPMLYVPQPPSFRDVEYLVAVRALERLLVSLEHLREPTTKTVPSLDRSNSSEISCCTQIYTLSIVRPRLVSAKNLVSCPRFCGSSAIRTSGGVYSLV